MIGLALFVCAVVGALRIATLTTRAVKSLAKRVAATLAATRKSIAKAMRRKPRTPKGIPLDDRQLLAMALHVAHEALKRSGQPVPTVAAWRETTSKAMVRS